MRRPEEYTDEMREELRTLYHEVDGLLEAYSCDNTTECCRFGMTGREPYPTAVELAEILTSMREHGIEPDKGIAKGRRRLPLAERLCPLLSGEGRCRIYASRPFGCRTFFCDRVVGPGKLPRDEIKRISRKIADLSARFAPRDPGARPLTRAFG